MENKFSLLKQYELLLQVKNIYNLFKLTNDDFIKKHGKDINMFTSIYLFHEFTMLFYNKFLYTKNKRNIFHENLCYSEYSYFIFVLQNKEFRKNLKNILEMSYEELNSKIDEIKSIGRNSYIIYLLSCKS
jgi:hypothetical protein